MHEPPSSRRRSGSTWMQRPSEGARAAASPSSPATRATKMSGARVALRAGAAGRAVEGADNLPPRPPHGFDQPLRICDSRISLISRIPRGAAALPRGAARLGGVGRAVGGHRVLYAPHDLYLIRSARTLASHWARQNHAESTGLPSSRPMSVSGAELPRI